MMVENAVGGLMVLRRMRAPSAVTGDEEAHAERVPIDAALLDEWALSYLGRYASSAENLRLVLRRRVRRRSGADAGSVRAADELIDPLVARYRAAGLIDDAAYAAARVRGHLARGHSLRRIAAGLMAKGIGAAEIGRAHV